MTGQQYLRETRSGLDRIIEAATAALDALEGVELRLHEYIEDAENGPDRDAMIVSLHHRRGHLVR